MAQYDFNLIDKAFDGAAEAYGVDADILRGMAYAESGFSEDVISGTRKSSAGAIGMMQFMPQTAERYGVDPLNPVEAVFGAAAYLRDNLAKFGGDYAKAIAAYNWGENRTAFDRDDWNKLLPEETSKYVTKVLNFAASGQGESSQKPLPKGIQPSDAGAGRGTAEDPRRLDSPVPTASLDELSLTPANSGGSMAPIGSAEPKFASVLETTTPQSLVRPEFVQDFKRQLGAQPAEKRLAALEAYASQDQSVYGQAARQILQSERAKNAAVAPESMAQAKGLVGREIAPASFKLGSAADPAFVDATPNLIEASEGVTPEQKARQGEIARGLDAAFDAIKRQPVKEPKAERTSAQKFLDFTLGGTNDSVPSFVLETAGDVLRGIAQGVTDFSASTWGLLFALADTTGLGGTSFGKVAREAAIAGQESVQNWGNPNDPNSMAQGVARSIVGSLASAGLTGGMGNAALTVMSASSAGNAYTEARAAGKSNNEALERATVNFLAEFLGEKIALPQVQKLFRSVGSTATMREFVDMTADLMKSDMVGEQFTTAVESLYDKFGSGGLNPNMTMSDYLEQVVQTAKSTFMQGMVTGGGSAGINRLMKPQPQTPAGLLSSAIDYGVANTSIDQRAIDAQVIDSLKPDRAQAFAQERAILEERLAEVKPTPQQTTQSIMSAQSVDEALAATEQAINQGTEAAAISQAIADNQADERVLSAESQAQTDAVLALEQSLPVEDTDEPKAIWTGRKGDGYDTSEDAQVGLNNISKRNPSYSWRVEQMPSGKYRIAGYAKQTQSIAPTVQPSAVAGNADGVQPADATVETADVQTQTATETPAQAGLIQQAEQTPEASAAVEPAPVQADTAPGQSTVDAAVQTKMNPTGTLTVSGDLVKAKQQLEAAGIKPVKSADGLRVSKKDAARAQEILSQGQPSGTADQTALLQDPDTQRREYMADLKKRNEKRARLIRQEVEKNPLREFLGRYGINSKLANEFAPGVTERRKAMVPGHGPIFRKNGLSLDMLAEKAAEEGFTNGEDADALYGMIAQVFRGVRVSPLYAEGVAESEMEARMREAYEQNNAEFDDYVGTQTEDPFGGLAEEEIAATGYDSATDAIKAEVDALIAMAESMGIDTETLREDAAKATADRSEQEYYELAKQILLQATQESTGGRSVDAAGANPQVQQEETEPAGRPDRSQDDGGQSEQDGLTLAAQTAADIEAQQARVEQAENEKATAERAAERAAAQEEDRKRIAQASIQAASSFELGGDAMQNLTGQQDIFAATNEEEDRGVEQPNAESSSGQPNEYGFTKRETQVLNGQEASQTSTPNDERIEDVGQWSNDLADGWPAKREVLFSTATSKKANGFYSALARGVDSINANIAPVAGWKDAIKGLVNKGMVKADEVEWTGIYDWLGLQPGKVSKNDVLAYLSANGVQVTETVLGTPMGGKELDDRLEAWANARIEEDGGNVVAKAILRGDSWDNLRHIMKTHPAPEVQALLDRHDNPAKYAQYTLPGGENYREVLLTLPSKKRRTAMEIAAGYGYGPNDPLPADVRDKISAESAMEMQRHAASQYKSGHWDQPNVLAHIRLNDRTDADGNRVLFVEEIQSDFGQDAKKKGVIKSYKPDEVQPISAVDAGKMTSADEELFWHFKTPDNVFSIPKSKYAERDAARDYIIREKRINSGGVPDAPFIGKTEGWLNLALKRVITMAVEGGYDKIAFVNGEQSADRYDLSKQVDQVSYSDDGILRAFQGRKNVMTQKVAPEGIEDYIGKEVAKRLLDAPMEDGRRVLMVESLKVGGTGMIKFYDSIVPNAVKALAKKLGGEMMVVTFPDAPAVRDGSREKLAAQEIGAQPGLTITDKMRETVAQGLPLFSRDRSNKRTYTPEQLREAARKSHGNLLDQGEKKGLVKLAGLDELIEQAAKDRAAVTGGDWQKIKQSILKSVQNSIRAWHGSPHRFDKFSLGAIGTGEGARAYGFGLYFANKREIAEWYRETLTRRLPVLVDGVPADPQYSSIADRIFNAMNARKLSGAIVKRTQEEAIDELISRANKNIAMSQGREELIMQNLEDIKAFEKMRGKAITKPDGQLYEVKIPEDSEMLLWDKPLSEQPDGVRKALKKAGRTYGSYDTSATGNDLYQDLVAEFDDSDKDASKALADLGIKGIKYLDGSSRDAGEGSFNYVVFDDADVEIVQLHYSSKGDVEGFHDPKTGKSYLNADVLAPDTIGPVLVHEMWHSANRGGALDAINARAAALIKSGKGNPFFDRVSRMLRDASETSDEEHAAYLVRAWEQDTINTPAPVKRWIQNLVAAIRAWMFNKGIVLKSEQLTEADIAAVARMRAKEQVAVRDGDGAVQFSKAKFENSEAFRRWFGDSKAVDENGDPLVVYHGTAADFTVFRRTRSGEFGPAIYTTDSPREAGEYGVGQQQPGVNIMPVYVSLKNPYTKGVDSFWKEFGRDDGDEAAVARAQEAGYDGVIAKRPDVYYDNESREFIDRGDTLTHYIVFRPEQIKSAIGNNGNYDPTNPDIRQSIKLNSANEMRAGMSQLAYPDNLKNTLYSQAKFEDVGGSYRKRFAEFVKDYRDSQPVDSFDYERSVKQIASEIESDWRNGNSDEYSRSFGPDEIHQRLRNENPAFYDEDDDLTEDGDKRYVEIESELSDQLAREYLGAPEKTNVDLTNPRDAAKVLHSYLESVGKEPSAIGGSGKSRSQYFTLDGKKIRISDHALPVEYSEADLDLVLADAGDDVRSDGRIESLPITEDEAQNRIADFAEILLSENNGNYDPTNPDIRYSRAADFSRPDRSMSEVKDKLIYEAQDRFIDLKRMQEAIEQEFGPVDDQFDARTSETLYKGRVSKRINDFHAIEVKPLLQKMARNKVSQRELSDYLLARGAPERNAQIAKINPDMPDGGAGTNSQGELMTTEAANNYLANIDPVRRMLLDKLAGMVDQITAGTRAMMVSEGLEDPKTIQAWERTYQYYVPMMKEEAEQGILAHHIQGKGFSNKGGFSRRAMGSEKEVTNMLAHVVMQRDAVITRAEKNRVGLSLYGLALTADNSDFWTVIRPRMSKKRIMKSFASMGIDPSAYENLDMVPTIHVINKKTKLVEHRPNPLYKNMPNALIVKVQGKDRVILFNEKNERAMRLVRSLKNDDRLLQIDLAGSIIGKTTRFMASMSTQYNPAFAMVNMARDMTSGMLNLSTTELAGKQLQVLANVPNAIQGIARALSGQERTEWSQLFDQFQLDGGQTGFREIFANAFEKTKDIEREMKRLEQAGKLTPGAMTHATLDLIDNFNSTIENAVRLSAYKVALDNGMSRPQAAKLARELTVDFNRQGRAGRELSPMYAFLNAAIQGNARTLLTLTSKAGRKIVVGGLALGAMQALMLMLAGFDDDEIPDYTKTNYLIIPTGGKGYALIPMALGFHVLPNTGRVITELLMTGGKNAGKKTYKAFGELVGAFNPLGGGDVLTADGALRTIMPTVLDPLVDLGFNKNFAGNSISKETFPGDARPGFKNVKEATARNASGQIYTGIAKIVNRATLGNDYKRGLASPTPEQIRHLSSSIGGGLYREIEKTYDTAMALAYGKEVKPSQIPYGGRWHGEVDDYQVERSRYFENKRKVDETRSQLKLAEKAGDRNAYQAVVDGNKVQASSIKMLASINRSISDLNRMVNENVDDQETLKRIDSERERLMRAFNLRIKMMEKQLEDQQQKEKP